jgi:hypothetical protein
VTHFTSELAISSREQAKSAAASATGP